jgi:hypothetical protein
MKISSIKLKFNRDSIEQHKYLFKYHLFYYKDNEDIYLIIPTNTLTFDKSEYYIFLKFLGELGGYISSFKVTDEFKLRKGKSKFRLKFNEYLKKYNVNKKKYSGLVKFFT